MWAASTPADSDVRLLENARKRFDLKPLAIHVSYLVNLASLDPVIRAKSIAAFRGELERADRIGAEYLVVHPGNYRGCSVEQGIAAFVMGLEAAAEGLKLRKLMLLLENTVGCGAQIGCRFEELRTIRDLAAQVTDLRLGYCLDTCHLLSAGFNIATQEGLNLTVRAAERILGLAHIRLIHTNDSKTPLGSRVDRHAHIGEGHIGAAGFRRILAHPKLCNKPFILETPIDQEGDDRRNLERLKKLCPRSRTTTTASS
jgi:deoxyribonuclease-4